jgi:transcriptional regulator with XRE-family HTH domain
MDATNIFCMAYYFGCMNTTPNFGQRLAQLRQAKGFSQQELADSTGISQRMLVYYEKHAKRPPMDKLQAIAGVLGVGVDELLGIAPLKKQVGAPKDAYLQRKLQKVKELPKDDQKIIMNMIDALASKKGT